MIRTILIVAASVTAALVIVVVAVGYALPQNHVAARTATFALPADQVFAAIADVARYPAWRGEVTRVEVVRTDPLQWREHSGGDVITFEVAESRPPHHFRVRIADPDLPFGGTWTYTLAPEGSGTRLTITEHGEVYNPIFRFMSRFVFGHTATIDRFLAQLSRSSD
ncbi:MAG TPA: SRPBCC family protein [Vicinamibacterales bacterium]|nr:SRPBCC family protein [Vicinamibacterales bacterium]